MVDLEKTIKVTYRLEFIGHNIMIHGYLPVLRT